ncbi:MAG TPA: PAS domain S-box protein, partial [Pyrinomonadaceae bacterium]|nr:PAS domain S-box protein [Pyrinomonadaceae bacterium]
DLWVIVCATPILDEHGAFTGSLSMLTDITKRKRVEEERARLNLQLESERQRLDNIVSSVPGVVWEAWGAPDAATQRIDFVSDYVEQMLGYSVEEWLKTPNFWLSIVHPDDRERVGRTAAEDFARGQSSGPLEFRWVTKDGHIVWVEANYVVVKGDKGQSLGLRGITTDISEQKQAEEALRQSEERYRLLFARNPQPMWVFDLETLSFLEVNDAAIHHYGYSREEFLTMTIKDIRPPENVPNLLANLSGGAPLYEEAGVWRHRKKDGTIIDVEITAHELTFYGRETQLVLASDVTERRLLEEQLRQSQKMEAIGQLAGGVAHDFNNLLTAITGYSDLAMRKLQREDPLQRNLEEIKRAGDRAASLTRQLLAFSRKQILQSTVLVINSVVSELEKMLRRLIGEDVDLKTVLEPQLGSIKADPGQIEQIIMNLVVNARDAMPQGGKLTIETENVYLDETYARRHRGVTPGHYVMLAVSDTGTGMDAATQARIFEPFFTTKEQGKGTGLGLSTVYGIVKQSGGNIWVYSEVGQGTTFKVYLPRVDEEAQEYKRTIETEELLQGTETILLAEDEEIVRQLAREILETYGYRVLEAANGGAALLICEREKEPIDLLITDVVMPEMSGRQLAARLSRLRPEMKVLYMSGYTDNAI